MTHPTPQTGTHAIPATLPRLAIEVPRLRAQGDAEREIYFAIEGSPPGSGRSLPTPDGGLRLVHDLAGVVVCVTATHLDLGSAVGLVRVRVVLPSAVRLDALLGHRVRLHTIHRVGDYEGFDLRLRGEDGRLALWAFDGAVPCEEDDLSVLPARGGVVLRSSSGDSPLPERVAAVMVEGEERRSVALRVGAARAAFVVVG